jgi:hypothetical protein
MRCDKTGTIVPFLMRAAATMLAGAVFLLPVSGQAKHSAPANQRQSRRRVHPTPRLHPTPQQARRIAPQQAGLERPPAGAGTSPWFVILMDRQRHGLHPAGRSPELPTAA